MTIQQQLNAALKEAFRSKYYEGVFEDTLEPQFILDGTRVLGSGEALTYKIIGVLSHEMVSLLFAFCNTKNIRFDIVPGSDVKFYIQNGKGL